MRKTYACTMCVVVFLCACEQRITTTTEICNKVLDTIVSLELEEQGFKDAVLLEQRKKDMRKNMHQEVEKCVGHPVRVDVLECLKKAPTAEAVSHQCLR